MWNRLRPLLDAMNVAGYVAWLAIGIELWSRAPQGTGLLPAALLWPAVVTLHIGFLMLFVLRQLLGHGELSMLGLVAAQLLLALALIAIARNDITSILLIVVMAQLAPLLPRRWLAVVFALGNASLYVILTRLWHAPAPLLSLLVAGSFQLFAMIAAWYAITAQRSRDNLAAVNADLLATRSLLDESIRDSERLRLSRELHDVAGHKLSALKLNLQAVQRRAAAPGDAQLVLCTQLADELLGDIRGVVQQMRLHDGVELRELIIRLAAPFPKPKLHLEMPAGLRVPSIEHADAVLRTVQEALTNAARHGGAENLWLSVQRQDGQLRLELHDDGRPGSGNLTFGNGLTGMRERLEAVGGGVRADRAVGGGVRVSAWLPASA